MCDEHVFIWVRTCLLLIMLPFRSDTATRSGCNQQTHTRETLLVGLEKRQCYTDIPCDDRRVSRTPSRPRAPPLTDTSEAAADGSVVSIPPPLVEWPLAGRLDGGGPDGRKEGDRPWRDCHHTEKPCEEVERITGATEFARARPTLSDTRS